MDRSTVLGQQVNTCSLCISSTDSAGSAGRYDMVDTIETVHNADKHIVLLGDMNYNYTFDESMSENQICLLENMFLLKQLIDTPTRVTENSSSLIDIILSNEPNLHVMSGVYQTSISDHYLVHTKIASNIIKTNHKVIRFRDYNKLDAIACVNDFNQIYTNIMLKWNTIQTKLTPLQMERMEKCFFTIIG